ncbi:MAG: HAD family hydrolase [Desulfovibrionales bacterium]
MTRKTSGIQAVIFDFDGTLAELNLDFGLMQRRLGALAGAFLEEVPESDGLPVLEWLDVLAQRIGSRDTATGLEFHSRGRLLITAMELEAARTGRLFPDTREILALLLAAKLKVGIITRNSTAAVKNVFPDIERCCDTFLARDSVPRPKPDPAHVKAALDRLGVEAAKALVVGDHPIDVQTARRAGCLSGAVASGNMSLEELAGHSPDFLARDCKELVAGLQSKKLLP